jgi:hypothetical protein
MATTSVEILFVGLCSFLNMNNQYSFMPPPSVVLHRTDQSMKHQAFIAWDQNSVALQNAASFPVLYTKNGTAFLKVDSEELALNDDQSAGPTFVDQTTFFKSVPRITLYGDLPQTPDFEPKHVPPKGQMPDPGAEAAYLEFGNGTISSDWQTEKQYVFRDGNGVAMDTTARYYHRRVKYAYTASGNALVIVARKFDNSLRRKLIFKPISGTAVTVWIGNSMNIDEDMNPTPPIKNKIAAHFKFFYGTLLNPPSTLYVPVIEGPLTPLQKPPAGGAGTGYCGPDNQP